jgi:hypothetical protein
LGAVRAPNQKRLRHFISLWAQKNLFDYKQIIQKSCVELIEFFVVHAILIFDQPRKRRLNDGNSETGSEEKSGSETGGRQKTCSQETRRQEACGQETCGEETCSQETCGEETRSQETCSQETRRSEEACCQETGRGEKARSQKACCQETRSEEVIEGPNRATIRSDTFRLPSDPALPIGKGVNTFS